MRDGFDLYCRVCRRRRNKDSRDFCKRFPHRRVKRKPATIAMSKKDPLAEVYEAIAKGRNTREGIQRSTHLHYDEIGDALVELIFEHRAVRIQNRSFVLVADREAVAAA